MPESSDDDIGGSTMPYCDDKPIKQEESEISNADSLDSAISFTEEAITEEAMAWNGEDMQHLEVRPPANAHTHISLTMEIGHLHRYVFPLPNHHPRFRRPRRLEIRLLL